MDKAFYVELGSRIASLRKEHDLSQEGLAELADLDPSYLARIETGDRKATVDVLGRIGDALEVGLSGLLVGSPSVATKRKLPADLQRLVTVSTGLQRDDVEVLTKLAGHLRSLRRGRRR